MKRLWEALVWLRLAIALALLLLPILLPIAWYALGHGIDWFESGLHVAVPVLGVLAAWIWLGITAKSARARRLEKRLAEASRKWNEEAAVLEAYDEERREAAIERTIGR
jgi:hypothetical protein